MDYRIARLLVCCAVALACCGCRGDNAAVPEPDSAPPLDLSLIPAPGSDLERGSVFVPFEKGVSKITTVLGSELGYQENGEIDGTSVTLNSSPGVMSFAIWLPYIEYEDGRIPYIVPYDITIKTNGDGRFYVALADFSTHSWKIVPTSYKATEVNVEVGLESNAGDTVGSFWFAIIAYGGESVTVNSIDYNLPGRLPGEPAQYETFIEARDGTALATDIFLPTEKTGDTPPPPYPVLLMRTPYDKDQVLQTEIVGIDLPKFLADLNVMLMLQYFRGRLDHDPPEPGWPNSEGMPSLFRDHAGPDHFDAIDTVDWIEDRNFYNGTLAASGPSALGLWIYQAAPVLGDRLAGMYPIAAAGDVGNWAAQRNGCYKLDNIIGWLGANSYPAELRLEADENYLNKPYWNPLIFDSDARSAFVRAPGYHETGWWDVDVEATIHSWKQLQDKGGSGAAGQQYLVIGPWSHDQIRGNVIGEITFPTTPAQNDARSVPMEWDGAFWLLNVLGRNPLFQPPTDDHVRYYMMGAEGSTSGLNNHWFTAADWPPDFEPVTLYFADGATGLSATAPPAETEMPYSALPGGVPTYGGANLPDSSSTNTGPYDQSLLYVPPIEKIVRLRGGALAAPLPIAGPVTVKLFVELTNATDALDTNVVVKLIDQYPTGENMLVADSAVRLSWYLGELPVLNQVYEIDLEVGQRAYLFEAGHKIGIDVQASNNPRFAENPGDGTPLGVEPGIFRRQDCVLHIGGATPSHVVLPEFEPTP